MSPPPSLQTWTKDTIRVEEFLHLLTKGKRWWLQKPGSKSFTLVKSAFLPLPDLTLPPINRDLVWRRRRRRSKTAGLAWLQQNKLCDSIYLVSRTKTLRRIWVFLTCIFSDDVQTNYYTHGWRRDCPKGRWLQKWKINSLKRARCVFWASAAQPPVSVQESDTRDGKVAA